jgi:hypothetical protein
MNWFMVLTAATQYAASVYGFYQGGQWRVATMNALVATANLVLAGAHA